MELRHLRYFVAVVEAGSLTVAAEKRLHTSQPSLSRQIRDLEREVGVELLTRSVTGVALTAAGRAFLDHARLALARPMPRDAPVMSAVFPLRLVMMSPFLVMPDRQEVTRRWHFLKRLCKLHVMLTKHGLR